MGEPKSGWRPEKPIVSYYAGKEGDDMVVRLVLTSADDARSFLTWAMDLPNTIDAGDPQALGEGR